MPDSMDKLHGNTNFSVLAGNSWNMFRYLGDYMHLIGIGVLLFTIAKSQSVAGISKKTQMLYLSIFVTRYLDLLDHRQSAYLTCFKLIYICSSAGILYLFHIMDKSYQKMNDTVNVTAIVVPCLICGCLFTHEFSIMEMLWTYSEFAEGFAMVPQYVFCYREKGAKSFMATLYVMCMGLYRVCYCLNWIYKKMQTPQYSDIQSWIGGVIEIIFFADFLNYRFAGTSFLRTAVLSVDHSLNTVSDKVEGTITGKVIDSSARYEDTDSSMRRRQKAEETEMATGV